MTARSRRHYGGISNLYVSFRININLSIIRLFISIADDLLCLCRFSFLLDQKRGHLEAMICMCARFDKLDQSMDCPRQSRAIYTSIKSTKKFVRKNTF